VEQLITVLGYYPVAVTAVAIGFSVQIVKLGFGAFGKLRSTEFRRFVYRCTAYLLGALAAIPAGWMPTQVDGDLFVERLCLGLTAALVSDLAYILLRKRYPALSGSDNA
jgi:hypothetical protein